MKNYYSKKTVGTGVKIKCFNSSSHVIGSKSDMGLVKNKEYTVNLVYSDGDIDMVTLKEIDGKFEIADFEDIENPIYRVNYNPKPIIADRGYKKITLETAPIKILR